MKRLLCLSIAGAFLLALPGAPLVWGKAHVPLNLVQVCGVGGDDDDDDDDDDGGAAAGMGIVKNIKAKKLAKELAKGGCRLPACAFNNPPTDTPTTINIFMPGAACVATDTTPADGFCDAANTPAEIAAAAGVSAIDITAPCTIQY